jgi:hypothetical protein
MKLGQTMLLSALALADQLCLAQPERSRGNDTRQSNRLP